MRIRSDIQRVPRKARLSAATVLVAAFLFSSLGIAHGDQAQIDDKRQQAADIAQRMHDAEERVGALDEQYNGAIIKLEHDKQSVADAQKSVADSQANIDEVSKRYKAWAVSTFAGSSSAGSILTNGITTESLTRGTYIEIISGDHRQIADDLRAVNEDLALKTKHLDEAKAQQEQRTKEAAALKAEADRIYGELQTLHAQVTGELATLVEAEQKRLAEEAAARERARIAQEEADRVAREAAAKAKKSSSSSSSGSSSSNSSDSGSSGSSGSSSGSSDSGSSGRTIITQNSGAAGAVEFAQKMLGVPYVWGGESTSGVDCSGLTLLAWASQGVGLSHYTGDQWNETTHIPLSELQPGDLIFYGDGISHVALYIGGGQIIHAPHRGSYVRVDDMYYWSNIVGAGRVTG